MAPQKGALLLYHRSQVEFPVPTWKPTTIFNSNSRVSMFCTGLLTHKACIQPQTHMWAKYTHTLGYRQTSGQNTHTRAKNKNNDKTKNIL